MGSENDPEKDPDAKKRAEDVAKRFQEQADAYEAVFQALYDEAIFVGALSFSYTYWDTHDKSPGIRGKPAEEVWARWAGIFSTD